MVSLEESSVFILCRYLRPNYMTFELIKSTVFNTIWILGNNALLNIYI